jgi:hypothetical protein
MGASSKNEGPHPRRGLCVGNPKKEIHMKKEIRMRKRTLLQRRKTFFEELGKESWITPKLAREFRAIRSETQRLIRCIAESDLREV